MKIYFDNRGYGDYTKERNEASDWTQEEYDSFMAAAKAEAIAAGVWE